MSHSGAHWTFLNLNCSIKKSIQVFCQLSERVLFSFIESLQLKIFYTNLWRTCTDGHQVAFFFPSIKLKEYVFPFCSAASTRLLPIYRVICTRYQYVTNKYFDQWRVVQKTKTIVKHWQNAYYWDGKNLVHDPITHSWHVLNEIHDSKHRLHSKDLRIKVAIWKL